MLELSRVATPQNMQIFWVLMLSTIVSISLAFTISILISKLVRVDIRIIHSFTLFISLPSLGSLPLILGRALCVPGGPLDGDPRCPVILGFMVSDLMIFQIQMFFIGYYIVMKDVDLFLPFEEKFHYLWHLYLYKKGKNDLVVLDLFEKYLKDKKQVKAKFETFVKENKIIHIKGIDFQFNLTDREANLVLIENRTVFKSPNEEPTVVVDNKCNMFDYSAIEIQSGNIILEGNSEVRTAECENIISANDVEIIKIKINKYYDTLFNYIEEDLNLHKKKEYEKEKQKILHNLEHFPPKFPTIRAIKVSKDIVNEINNDFKLFEEAAKAVNPKFKLTHYKKKSKLYIYGRVYYPPIIACFLGLLVGLSGMRDIAFSSNHYLKNFFDVWPIITVVNVSFIYTTAGYAMAATSKITMNMILTFKEIVIGILIRFIIVPGIGLLWIYLWVTFYGGIVIESKVVRFAMFIPFCAPVSATLIVFLNLVNIYVDEAGYHIFIQYILSLVLLSTVYLVYFITLGS
jgi:predicted permease